MVGLGDLPGGLFASQAYGVNADGSIVVGSGWTPEGKKAMIWDKTNGMRELEDVLANELGLDLTGWTLNHARGISADGFTIVGAGINPDGNYEAWVANINPIPIPGAVWLLGSGLIGIVGIRRKFKN